MMLTGRTLVVITGASKGYGRALALALASVVGQRSLFLLLSRDSAGLDATSGLVSASCQSASVLTRSVDLCCSEASEVKAVLESAVGEEAGFETALLIHNAGSIGPTGVAAGKQQERTGLVDYYALNLVSPMLVTGAFLSVCRERARQLAVVNVSSLLAVQPVASLSVYAAGKAGRDMFFRSLAVEEAGLRVLNWAPGPMDTDMVKEIMENTFDSGVKEMFANMKFVVAEESAKWLIKVLEEDKFESGAHIDVFDVMPAPADK